MISHPSLLVFQFKSPTASNHVATVDAFSIQKLETPKLLKRNFDFLLTEKKCSLEPASTEDSSVYRNKSKDILSGFIVGLINIGPTIAYSRIVGVDPIIGLWSSVFIGLVSALYGGCPGLIAGAASAVCVPLAKVSKVYGLEYMCATVMLSAAIQASFSLMKFGRFVSLVSEAILCGFLNSLGFIIAQSQLVFLLNLQGVSRNSSIVLVVATAAAIKLISKIQPNLPSSLFGLFGASLMAIALDLPVQRLVDIGGMETFSGSLSVLPKFTGQTLKIPYTLQTFQIILPAAFTIALISVNSLITCRIVENYEGNSQTPRIIDKDKVIMGFALGNALSALTGGFGGCGLLPMTVLNLKNGGRGSASSLTASLVGILAIAAGPLIGQIPVPALVGIMFTVAFDTIKWSSTLSFVKNGLSREGTSQDRMNCFTLIAVFLICYCQDMAVGLLVGIFITHLREKISPNK